MDAEIFVFAGSDWRHAYVSKHIILKTNIYELLQKYHKQMHYKNVTTKCKRVGSKQISFGCFM